LELEVMLGLEAEFGLERLGVLSVRVEVRSVSQ
jgi:hypothetical protein